MNALVSVIIPVWNGRSFLQPLLEALAAQDYPSIEVIAVDNGSTDGSATVIAERFPSVRLIRNERNLGFAGGCNTGLRAARGDILALLNQDTVPAADWVSVIARAALVPERGIAGSKIFYPGGGLLQHAGGWFEWPLGLAHHFGQGERDSDEWSQSREVEYVTGAAVALRRDVLERVGLLDEGFWPGYFEDGDFCFRIRDAGYQVWYEAQAVVTHHESTSVRDQTLISQYYQRGRLRFLLKHLPPERFLAEVVPAEEGYQPPAISGLEGSALRLAYLQSMLDMVPILVERWQADGAIIERMSQALARLHQSGWRVSGAQVDRTLARRDPAQELGPASESISDEAIREALLPTSAWLAAPPPVLTEQPFRSSTPFLGPLIAKARAAWYSVAARWGVQELRQQQQTVNDQTYGQLQFHFHRLQVTAQQMEQLMQQQAAAQQQAQEVARQIAQQFNDLATGQARIAQELASLQLEMRGGQGDQPPSEIGRTPEGDGPRGTSSTEIDPQ